MAALAPTSDAARSPTRRASVTQIQQALARKDERQKNLEEKVDHIVGKVDMLNDWHLTVNERLRWLSVLAIVGLGIQLYTAFGTAVAPFLPILAKILP